MKKLLAALGTILSAGLIWFASTLDRRAEPEQVDRSPASVVVALQYQKEAIKEVKSDQVRLREEVRDELREVKADIKTQNGLLIELLQRVPKRSEVSSARRSKKEEPN